MSRIASGQVAYSKPTNTIYTVLAIVATLVNIIGFLVIFTRFTTVFGDKANLFQ
jgi:hypothetical protein